LSASYSTLRTSPFLVVGAVLLGAGDAAADEKTACLDAHVEGQHLRNQGKLVEATRRFDFCARRVCPGVVQTECAQWLAETRESVPSISVAARDLAGRDTLDVSLVVDGVRVRDRLDGLAIPLDPGEHALTFALGTDTIELHVVAVEGDKSRKIVADFSTLHPAEPPTLGSPLPLPAPSPVPMTTIRPVPTWTFVLGGVAVAALGTFATFAALGREQQSVVDGCKPGCVDRTWQVMNERYVVADISWITAAVSLGAATWVFLARPSQSVAPSTGWLTLTPAHGGAAAQMGARF